MYYFIPFISFWQFAARGSLPAAIPVKVGGRFFAISDQPWQLRVFSSTRP